MNRVARCTTIVEVELATLGAEFANRTYLGAPAEEVFVVSRNAVERLRESEFIVSPRALELLRNAASA